MTILTDKKQIAEFFKNNPDAARLVEEGFSKDAEEMEFVHVTPTPEPCDHEWNNGGCNPTHCEKCGMSFTAYTFMECE